MTNFNNATKSFTLHAEGTESYAWAWEGIDRVQCLSEIEHTNNDIVAYAHGWACELCHNCIAQIDPEGERGFTAEEITHDLIDDRHALADALQAWLEGEYDQDKQEEPLYTITHPMMGDWDVPATIAEISADVAMNWRDENIKYTVDVKWGKVVIYGMDYESNSRDWREWLDLGDGEYRLEIGELYQPEEEGDDEPDPQPFGSFGVETAVRLVEEGYIEECAGIYIARASGYAGDYDISKDVEDRHLYEVVWVQGGNGSYEIMTKEAVITLIREESELGARFFWQVMENDWEITNAPYLQGWHGYMGDIRNGRTPETNYFDPLYAKMIADAEAYEAEFLAMNLGESTLAKIRRQKELIMNDRPQSPETLAPQNGFEVVYGGWANGAGGLDNPRVVVFADRASFEAQNPNWAEMIEDAKHRQASPFTNLGNIYLFDRPEGGYEIYPRDGRTRADGSVAEIW